MIIIISKTKQNKAKAQVESTDKTDHQQKQLSERREKNFLAPGAAIC